MKYRLILASTENGNRESVRFCDIEDKSPGRDFCLADEGICFDGIIEVELPGSFPVNYTLVRE